MLVKLAGAAIIVGCTSYAGWQVAGGYARRPVHLRDLQTALSVLETEVDYGATPLPEALMAAARAGGPAVGPLFADTARRLAEGEGMTPGDALRAAWKAGLSQTALLEADAEPLYALAEVLGASGRGDQVRHLALARQRLTGQEARAAEDRTKYERLARYMGVLSGALLVLILI